MIPYREWTFDQEIRSVEMMFESGTFSLAAGKGFVWSALVSAFQRHAPEDEGFDWTSYEV